MVEQHVKWLRALGKREGWNLAALTGQDARALRVFIASLELYAVSDGNGRDQAVKIMQRALFAMQRQCRIFAKRVIPAVLDWGDEDRLWSMMEET
jgi:hypothetical protein